jgi:undecaprenyl-diphosphatase
MSTTAQTSYPGMPKRTTPAPLIAWHVIIGIILGGLCSALFIGIMDWVTDGEHGVIRFDRTVLLWMHARQMPVLTGTAHVLAWMGSPTVIIAIAVLGMIAGFADRTIRGAAWTFPIAAIGAGVIIQCVKLAVHRTRPDLFRPLLHEQGYSFPSGHSLIAIVIYGLIGYFALGLTRSLPGRIAIVTVTTLIVLAIGVSRVYVGVHYPTDVLAGWSGGAPWLVVCIGLHEVMVRRWNKSGKAVLNQPPAISRAVGKATEKTTDSSTRQ